MSSVLAHLGIGFFNRAGSSYTRIVIAFLRAKFPVHVLKDSSCEWLSVAKQVCNTLISRHRFNSDSSSDETFSSLVNVTVRNGLPLSLVQAAI